MGYSGGKGIDILFIALILLLLSIHSLTRYGLIIPFILLCALYAPVGAIYGSPSAVVVSALLQSNPIEAREFCKPSRSAVICCLSPFWLRRSFSVDLFGDTPVKENNIDRIGPAYGDYYRQSIQRWGE